MCDVMNNTRWKRHFHEAIGNGRDTLKRTQTQPNTHIQHEPYVDFVQFMLDWKLLFIFMHFIFTVFAQWQFSLLIFYKSNLTTLTWNGEIATMWTSASRRCRWHVRFSFECTIIQQQSRWLKMGANEDASWNLNAIAVTCNSLHYILGWTLRLNRQRWKWFALLFIANVFSNIKRL